MAIPLYHITHLDNLPSILKAGGLIANSGLKKQQINYLDIAYGHIQDRRASTPVPCSAGGVLHDYVPFYFAPRSPMLFAIHKGNVAGYQGGQDSVIYLVTLIKRIIDVNLFFAFTDGHAVMDYTNFYDELEDSKDAIDWDLMESPYWFNTEDDPDRKCRRQAEFLIHQSCPWNAIEKIGVINQTIQAQVEKSLQLFNSQKVVNIQHQWYYQN